MLRGAEQLCFDLIERPDDVKRVAAHIDRVGMDAHAAFYAVERELGQSQTVTWARRVRADILRDDAVRLFREHFPGYVRRVFVLPGLRAVSGVF